MGKYLPKGNYLSTSKEVNINLFCEAKQRNKAWVPASLNITELNKANIANMDGYLINDAGSAPTHDFIPGGSYEITARNMTVILSACCQKNDLTWNWSTLNITYLDRNKTVSNKDGNLIID